MRQEQLAVHRCVEARRALALLVLLACAGAACSDDNATASNSASQPDAATAPSSSPSADASAAGVDASAPDGAASTASSGLPDVYVCQAVLAAHPPDPGGQGAEPAPAPLKPCGVYKNMGPSAGVCMSKVLARASNNPAVDLLPQDICSDSEVCMPNLKAADPTACFDPCETSALVQAAGSKEGGCIPPYIAAFSNPEAIRFLAQGTCAAGELCAPCLDPTKDFAVTGACN